MKKGKLRLLALVLAAVMLLAGCGYLGSAYFHYDEMQYERPNPTEVEQALDVVRQAAAGEDVDAVMDGVYTFYDAYDWYYTCYSLAEIRYSGDLTDIYWEKEYNYCVEHSPEVSAALEELYYILAQSPCREELEEEYFGEDYFEGYEGENQWDETFTAMLEEEAQLQSEYYALAEQAQDHESGSEDYYDSCADEMAGLLVELVELRQEIAASWGYSDYIQFANDFYYYRDYTAGEMEAYLEDIQQELVPIYREIAGSEVWDGYNAYCGEKQTLEYVRTCAKNMGGTVADAFEMMESAGLYDIAYGENKYNSSFEVYLTSYWEPFIFMNPTLTAYDQLSLAHEFGHFCNDYACYGSYAGVDVSEFFSQGMEYLSLCYGEDTEALTRLKMADSLCTYVEQAAFASFEVQMYALEEPTVEDLYELYDQVAACYGFDSMDYDRREFVDITHYYTNPMYIISYVVSNDAAMQLYQLEQEQAGAGLALYEENLDSQETWFQVFLEDAGLESPFDEGRAGEVRALFEEILK